MTLFFFLFFKGLYVLQEQIDEDFFRDRNFAWNDSSVSLWKMGDRKNDNQDSPKTSFANSTVGREFFEEARRIAQNGTVSQVESLLIEDLVIGSLAATSLSGNRDGVPLGHNVRFLGRKFCGFC